MGFGSLVFGSCNVEFVYVRRGFFWYCLFWGIVSEFLGDFSFFFGLGE